MEDKSHQPSLAEQFDINGWFQESQGKIYNEVVSKILCGTIAEVGVFQGRGLSHILETCRRNKNRIYAIDKWTVKSSYLQQKLKPGALARWESAWRQGRDVDAEGTIRDFSGVFLENIRKMGFEDIVECVKLSSEEASKQFEDNFFDLVFIDARHAYEHVKNDIQSWLPKVKDGGVICGHDYSAGWPGVVRAVNECFPGRCVIQRDRMWFVRKGFDYSI